MDYRPEIDGLRALAVVPVVLYHAGLNWLAGGYLGVDVFFVVSGYLITTILRDQLATGTFSLSGFYLRRARRILPALLLVMIASLPLAFLTMLPRVRHAFERLHERQRRSFADRVAQRYGLLDTVSITDVKETSAGAGARLAVIDARVAEILKDWTF